MPKLGRIETDTVILPDVIADSVIREAAAYLHRQHKVELKDVDTLAGRLVARANSLYAANYRWRQRVRQDNTYGRDYLYTFMRHWLSGELYESQHSVFNLLPYSFRNGQAI